MSRLAKNKKTGYYTNAVDSKGHVIGEMKNLHDPRLCAERGCAIHAHPSQHPLMDAPLLWRDDRNILERICQHGVGHPDHDAALYLITQGQDYQLIHGCDMCCQADVIEDDEPSFPDKLTPIYDDVPNLKTPMEQYNKWRATQYEPSVQEAWLAAWEASAKNESL